MRIVNVWISSHRFIRWKNGFLRIKFLIKTCKNLSPICPESYPYGTKHRRPLNSLRLYSVHVQEKAAEENAELQKVQCQKATGGVRHPRAGNSGALLPQQGHSHFAANAGSKHLDAEIWPLFGWWAPVLLQNPPAELLQSLCESQENAMCHLGLPFVFTRSAPGIQKRFGWPHWIPKSCCH